jgi:hypothetical protein
VVTTDPGEIGIYSNWGGNAVVINYGEITTNNGDGIQMYSNENRHGEQLWRHRHVRQHRRRECDRSRRLLRRQRDQRRQHQQQRGRHLRRDRGCHLLDRRHQHRRQQRHDPGRHLRRRRHGIESVGYYGSSVSNSGDITSGSFNGDAVGIYSVGIYGDASVDNSGTIEAYSLTGYTVGAAAISVYYDASVTNSGGIYVGGDGQAVGAVASATTTRPIDNSGTIEATSYYDSAYGAVAIAKYDDGTITNSGTVDVTGYTNSAGLAVVGYYDATVTNSGTVNVYTSTTPPTACSRRRSTATPTSTTPAASRAVSGDYGTATGIYAYGYYDANVTNSGSVYASGKYAATASTPSPTTATPRSPSPTVRSPPTRSTPPPACPPTAGTAPKSTTRATSTPTRRLRALGTACTSDRHQRLLVQRRRYGHQLGQRRGRDLRLRHTE